MDVLLPLWLPILLSTVAVWFVAMIVWTVLPHHRHDFINLPDEDRFMDELRRSGIKPGNYTFPDGRGRAKMQSEKVQKAWQEGPVGHLSLWPTPLTMGGKLAGTFAVYLVVSTLIAFLTRTAIPGPAAFARVFTFAATAGILAYGFSHIPNALWWSSYKRTIAANVVDGILYGVITGAIFAWLWPR